jgi:hypothetical protein
MVSEPRFQPRISQYEAGKTVILPWFSVSVSYLTCILLSTSVLLVGCAGCVTIAVGWCFWGICLYELRFARSSLTNWHCHTRDRRTMNEVTKIMFVVSHTGRGNLILWPKYSNFTLVPSSIEFFLSHNLFHSISEFGVWKIVLKLSSCNSVTQGKFSSW